MNKFEIFDRISEIRSNAYKRLGMYQGSLLIFVVVAFFMLISILLVISTSIDFLAVFFGFKTPNLIYTETDYIPITYEQSRSLQDYYVGLIGLMVLGVIVAYLCFRGLRWYVRLNREKPALGFTYEDCQIVFNVFNGKFDNPKLKSQSTPVNEVKAVERLNKEIKEYLDEFDY